MGFILSLISGLFRAIEFAFIKELVKDINPYILALGLITIELVVSLPFFFFFGIPTIESAFWRAAGTNALIYAGTTILLSKTLKELDMSIAMPLTSFVPVLTYVLGIFMLGETAGIQGVIGIIVILIGNYMLSSSKLNHWYDSLLAPFSSYGAKLMLAICVLWAIANPIGKIAIESSSTFFYVSTSYLFASLLLIPLIAYQGISMVSIKKTFQNKWKVLVTGGIIRGLSRMAMLLAFSYILVAYTISIKRTGILIAILIGWLYFGEKNISKRLLASFIMISGVLLIVFEH